MRDVSSKADTVPPMRGGRYLIAAALACCLLVPASASGSKEPTLSYGRAKQAAQAKANSFAKTPTRITAMYRLGSLVYSARAEWSRTNPTGCAGCGYDPITGNFYDTATVESCSVSLHAKLLASGRIRVGTEDFACY
jgi:hypothetical protein